MGRRLLATGMLRARASPRRRRRSRASLWPGVTFDTGVQFTPNGPVAINILTGPRPGGTTTLAPALSNDTLTGPETLTAIERRTAAAGDDRRDQRRLLHARDSGVPSGVLMRDGQVASPPSNERASAGVTTRRDARRAPGRRSSAPGRVPARKRTLQPVQPAAQGQRHRALHARCGARRRRRRRARRSAILFPFPAAIPNTDLAAPVVDVHAGGAAVPIPPGGAVLVAVGAAAAALTAEAPVGQLVTTQPHSASPTGPASSRRSAAARRSFATAPPVFRAGELFTTSQLGPARAAQRRRPARRRADHPRHRRRSPARVLGRDDELRARAGDRAARCRHRRWRSTAAARRRWRSTGRCSTAPPSPSGRSRRRCCSSTPGVFVQPAVAVVSPDGDGVADRQSLRYKLVRPSTVTVKLTRPDGSVGYEQSVTRQPGSYAVAFPPPATLRTRAVPPPASPQAAAASSAGPAQGRWTAHRLGDGRHRPDLGDDAVVRRQHDDRLPRDDAEEALPAAASAATSGSAGSSRRARASSSRSRRAPARSSARSRSGATPRARRV